MVVYEGKPRPSVFEDMTTLARNTVDSMMFGTLENRGIDYIAGVDCIRYNSLLRAKSMAFDFDLGRDLWLNRSRWTKLVRDYLDLQETRDFIKRAADIGNKAGRRGVITSLNCRIIERRLRNHRWGGCLMGYSFHGHRTAVPTFTMHSRVSYIAYIGQADLALAHTLARYIAKKIDVPVEQFQFNWAIDSLQLHCFKSLPYLYSRGYLDQLLDKELRSQYPSFKIIGRWIDQVVEGTANGVPLESIKYGPQRRITRRYREFINEDYLPKVPVSSLDLSPLTKRR